MHHCLNVVTEPDGFPAAVLIRALEPTVGVEVMRRRRGHLPDALLLSGPGRVCAGLGLDRSHDGLDLASGPLWIGSSRREPGAVSRGPRVGIRVARERPWRLWIEGHRSVSRGPKEPRALRPRTRRARARAQTSRISG